MLKLAVVCTAAGLLAACSLAPIVDQDVLDYFRVNDLATNRIILLNVLRAKDRAPLHFSELSQVRGQVTAGMTAGAVSPIGPISHTTAPRGSANISANVSTAPSFDIVSLDTQDFTVGVMAPIKPATMKFFLDEGVDYRLVLMLLSSGMRPAGEQELILNAPQSARVVCYRERTLEFNARPTGYQIIDPAEVKQCSGFAEPEFYGFLRLLNNLRRVYAITYRASHPVGAPFSLAVNGQSLRDLTAIDPSKYQLRQLADGRTQLMAEAKDDSVILCEASATGGRPAPIALVGATAENLTVPADVCAPRGAAASGSAGANADITLGSTPNTYVIALRSTLEVVGFLGRILAFQEANSKPGNERCITLLPVPLSGSTCDGAVLFRLQHDEQPNDIGLTYGDQYWAVPPAAACKEDGPCDHTLESMSIVALLLNQNKSAKDIGRTPAVEVVP